MKLIINDTPEKLGRVLFFKRELPHKKKCESNCLHQTFIIDEAHGSVECKECNEIVSAFHAIKIMAQRESRYFKHLEAARKEYIELQQYKPWLKAVKKLEHIWRGKYLPGCPHCFKGVEAESLSKSGLIKKPEKPNLELI